MYLIVYARALQDLQVHYGEMILRPALILLVYSPPSLLLSYLDNQSINPTHHIDLCMLAPLRIVKSNDPSPLSFVNGLHFLNSLCTHSLRHLIYVQLLCYELESTFPERPPRP